MAFLLVSLCEGRLPGARAAAVGNFPQALILGALVSAKSRPGPLHDRAGRTLGLPRREPDYGTLRRSQRSALGLSPPVPRCPCNMKKPATQG